MTIKLFARTGGHWLFWTGVVYFVLGTTFGIYHKEISAEAIQLIWIMAMILPFIIPPFGRWLNMSVEWDRKMFDWFKSREERKEEYNNVVKFPEPKEIPKMPYVAPPEPVPEPKVYYTFGLTSDNRVSFQMGYTTLTMNSAGVQILIDQLEFFKDQLGDE